MAEIEYDDDNDITEVEYGDYEEIEIEREFVNIYRCNLTPQSINVVGACDYYKLRFEDFMKRHDKCKHQPPVYYYGPLASSDDDFDLLDQFIEHLSPVVRRTIESIKIPVYSKKYEQTTYKPVPAQSYGYKYCVIFSNDLMPRLTPDGVE